MSEIRRGLFYDANTNARAVSYLPAFLDVGIAGAGQASWRIVKSLAGPVRWLRRGRRGGRSRFVGNFNVGHVAGRSFHRAGVVIPDPAHIPPPAEPPFACSVVPSTVLPGTSAVMNTHTTRGARRRRLHETKTLCGGPCLRQGCHRR